MSEKINRLQNSLYKERKSVMNLIELLDFNDIVIQCHDDPDADAVASGFGVYKFLLSHGKRPRLIYSGKTEIKKPNMRLMIDKLKIPVEYVTSLDHEPELLVTVDCFYGESNVQKFNAGNIAVIDHHVSDQIPPMLSEIQSDYGSCASVVAKMLAEEGFDVNSDCDLATALYYGLYMDTNGFSELGHPADKDLRDFTRFSEALMNLLRNSNLSCEDMSTAATALANCKYDFSSHSAVAMVEPCDPSILGFIGDLLIQVDNISTCIVFCRLGSFYKLSVRSCTKEVRASEFTKYLTFGAGGGHAAKAGGKVDAEKLNGTDPVEFFRQRVVSYYANTSVIRAGKDKIDTSGMRQYVKRDIVVGYVLSTDILKAGTEIIVRTLEGDITVKAEDNIYIMVGIEGEVYLINREKFMSTYRLCDDELPDMAHFKYTPHIIDKERCSTRLLNDHIKGCVATGGSVIMAKELTSNTKVFLLWDEDNYFFGTAGDYLAVRADDPNDVYIIKKEIFKKTYDPKD